MNHKRGGQYTISYRNPNPVFWATSTLKAHVVLKIGLLLLPAGKEAGAASRS